MQLDLIDPSDIATFGGKATNLARLRRIDGVDVPDGFAVSTAAFEVALQSLPDHALRRVRDSPHHSDADRSAARRLRDAITGTPVPAEMAAAIADALSHFPADTPFAVRSSATAEDLAGTSFAGQHDSHLDRLGADAVIDAVRSCWASLFTERAVAYGRQAGTDDDRVAMGVVVQQMVTAEASGVMFTADPITGDRRSTTIEAVHGRGDVLVAGTARPDSYHVRGGQVVSCAPAVAGEAVLSPALATRIARLGRRIEAAMGGPQDIEWCLRDDRLFVVQSRPITTLFPVPPQRDECYRVYLSVGHQQMMTDAMTSLGLSCWQMTTPAPMAEAGNRLWVDVSARLASPGTRDQLLRMAGEHDLLTLDALNTVLDGGRLRAVAQVEAGHDAPSAPSAAAAGGEGDIAGGLPAEPDPALVRDLIARSERSVAEATHRLIATSGVESFAALREDWQELRRRLFDSDGLRVLTSAMAAATWLNEHLAKWLDESNAADALTRGVDHDPTSQMGLALLDVADVIRPHPGVIGYLSAARDDATLLAGLDELDGGPAVRASLESWLRAYGARCPGEIDLARPRWAERPTTLIPLILGHVRNAEPGEAAHRIARAQREADEWERRLLDRLREQPDGTARVEAVQRHIAVLRVYIGYREYPKYAMTRRYWIYKQILLNEIERLVAAGVLRSVEDAFHLRFDELEDAVRTNQADLALIDRRRAEYRASSGLLPPRVLTSDGEALHGAYRRSDVSTDVLVGLAASAGTVTGRARVVLDPDRTYLEAGDILVTRFTDPSWTPLFVTASALVTEIGGFMTHGAVVAREYGLPAVLGVDRATTLIRDGQQIRVDGSRGWVELT